MLFLLEFDSHFHINWVTLNQLSLQAIQNTHKLASLWVLGSASYSAYWLNTEK